MSHGKIEQIGRHRKQCRGMYDLLQEYSQAGIQICLEGKEAEPGQVAATCLREGVSYMMDFIPENDSSQRITQIDFTKIDSPQQEVSSTSSIPGRTNPSTPPGDTPPSPLWCG